MTGAVYLLCAATSLACAVLLLRGYRNTYMRLLLWSGLCFIGLALDNLLLFFDVVLIPDTNLALYRKVPGTVGIVLHLYGLVWESG